MRHIELMDFLKTGFEGASWGTLAMILIGLLFIYLGVFRKMKPMLLISIGFGILIGNIGTQVGTFGDSSTLSYLNFELLKGVYPLLIFLGLGAMIDFSALIANPKLVLIGIAAQFGIFFAFMVAILFKFPLESAGAISLIGSADAVSSLFLASRLAPELLSAIVITTFLCMAMVPTIQPSIMRLLTTEKERVIKMATPRAVSQTEKIVFPCVALLLTVFLVPKALPLLGMLFFGNLLKECGIIKHLSSTSGGTLTNVLVVLIGLTVGIFAQAETFLTTKTLLIFIIGAAAFKTATMSGILFVKLMNLFLKDGNKINPLIGNAGVSALPDAAQMSQNMGLRYDSSNHLLSHAMGATAASIIGSALAAGILLRLLG